jgi:hypothetical protein
MTTNFYPSNLQWVGIAKETTYGTAVSTPTVWIPVDAPKYKANITPLKDKNLRGSMASTYQQQAGMRHDELGYKTYFYLDSIYPHFLAMMGNPDTVTGAGDPYSHVTSLYNGSGTNAAQPPSYTLFWADGAGKVQQMPGSIIAEIKVTLGADALSSLDVKWVTLPANTITPPTNTPSTVKPMPSWNTTISIGGVASTTYSSIDLNFKRATEVIPTITGTQAPYAIFGGPVDVTGSFTGVFQNATADVDWTNYLVNTQPAMVVKSTPPGETSPAHFIQMAMSQVAYDAVEVSGTNKWQEVKTTLQAIANSTDALSGSFSPAKITMQSSVSTAY